MRVTVEKWKAKRTLTQNAYLWGVVYQTISEDTGNSAEDVHEALKGMYCPPQVIRMGEEERQVRSTKRLDTTEMADYIDQCIAFAATDLGIDIPAPGEYR